MNAVLKTVTDKIRQKILKICYGEKEAGYYPAKPMESQALVLVICFITTTLIGYGR
jgi:hypothetical protein